MLEQGDKLLIRQCLEGNTEAFGHLVERYNKQIFNLAYRLTGSYHAACDISQSVFLKAYENLKTYNENNKFFSWIYRIALNESLNTIKKINRTDALNSEINSTQKNPAEEYEQIVESKLVQKAILGLKIKHRQVIVLKYFQQLSYEEISCLLDISVKKVKSRLFSARALLKEKLLKNGISAYD